jgi:hypothetical protein
MNGCERRDVTGRRDGRRGSDALEDLLALVDFRDFLVEELVAALAEVDDLGVGREPRGDGREDFVGDAGRGFISGEVECQPGNRGSRRLMGSI